MTGFRFKRRPQYRAGLVNRPYSTKRHLVAYIRKLEQRVQDLQSLNKLLTEIAQNIQRSDFSTAYNLTMDNAAHIFGVGYKARRKVYPPEYKQEVVRRCLLGKDRGYTTYEIAKQEGLPLDRVYDWISAYKAGKMGENWADIAGCALTDQDELPSKDEANQLIVRYTSDIEPIGDF